MFTAYSAHLEGYLSIFQQGVQCGHRDFANYGDGQGAASLCKMCPAFAVQPAAVGVRMLRPHWGPLHSRAAEIRPEADALLQQVAAIVDGVVA